jgi:hypothetical protein
MNDSRDQRHRRADTGERPPGARIGGVEDTPVPNPLAPGARHRVAQWLEKGAAGLDEELDAGPDAGELAARRVDRDAWVRRMEEGIRRVRRVAEEIQADTVPFSAAAQARNLLRHAERHDLIAAGAALDAALIDAIPERMQAYDREVERRLDEDGFCIEAFLGRGEPMPLPDFTYTVGLGARASHPELVIVGFSAEVASALLADLSTQILAGERSLRAGEDLDGLLTGGYTLRVSECPPQLVARTRQDPVNPAGALQLLLPDQAGLFPGDPGVDPKFVQGQQYPDYSA